MSLKFRVVPSRRLTAIVARGFAGPTGSDGPNLITDQTECSVPNVLFGDPVTGKVRSATNAEVISQASLSSQLAPYLTAAIAANTYVPRAGGTMTGNLVVPDIRFTNVVNDVGIQAITLRNNFVSQPVIVNGLDAQSRGTNQTAFRAFAAAGTNAILVSTSTVDAANLLINGNGSVSITNGGHQNTYNCQNASSDTISNIYRRYGVSHGNAGSILLVEHMGGTISAPSTPVSGTTINSLSFRTGGTGSIATNPSFQLRHVIGSAIGFALSEVNTQLLTTPTATGVPAVALELLGQTSSVRIPNSLVVGSASVAPISNIALTLGDTSVASLRMLAFGGSGSWVQMRSVFNNTNPDWIFANNQGEIFRLSNDGRMSLGTTVLGARLQVRGTGNTSATNTARFENSDGSALFTVRDDGVLRVGNSANSPLLFGFDTNAYTSISASGRGLAMFGGNNVVNGAHIGIGGDTFSMTSGSNNLIVVGNTFAPASGTANFSVIRATPTINQSGGATGISRAFNAEPTLSAAADWRSFDTNVNSGFAYHSSGSAPSRLGGSLTVVGNLGFATARVEQPLTQSMALRTFESTLSAWQEPWIGRATPTGPVIGFLGASPIGRQTLPAAATDPATTQALANSIRSILINFGFAN